MEPTQSFRPPRAPGSASAEEIELQAQIDTTRTQLTETINTLEERLNPHTIAGKAKDAVRDTAVEAVDRAQDAARAATIGKVEHMVNDANETAKGMGSSIIETIKQNPLPAAMAAAGIGWLFMNRSKGASDSNFYPKPYRQDKPYRQERPFYTGPARGQVRAGSREDGSSSPLDQAQSIAGGALDQAQSAATGAVNQVQSMAGQAQETIQGAAGQAQDQMQRAQGQLQRTMETNPLAVGAAALAVGLAVGLAIPETQPESQFMGEARDSLMDTVQESAQNTMHKAQGVASKAAGAAKEEARSQGLSS